MERLPATLLEEPVARWPLESVLDAAPRLLLEAMPVGIPEESRSVVEDLDTRVPSDVLDDDTELLDEELLNLLAHAAL